MAGFRAYIDSHIKNKICCGMIDISTFKGDLIHYEECYKKQTNSKIRLESIFRFFKRFSNR